MTAAVLCGTLTREYRASEFSTSNASGPDECVAACSCEWGGVGRVGSDVGGPEDGLDGSITELDGATVVSIGTTLGGQGGGGTRLLLGRSEDGLEGSIIEVDGATVVSIGTTLGGQGGDGTRLLSMTMGA